jgi:hypothetical protein
MATSTTQKKTGATKKKAGPPLKKPSKSSKTPTSTKNRGSTKESPKSGSQDKVRRDAILRSFWSGKAIEEEYAHGGLPPAKKGESTPWLAGRTVTPEERAQIQKISFRDDGTPNVRIVGRPKKAADEKQNVKTLRLSAKQEQAFMSQALKDGFHSWQTWIKKIAEERAGLRASLEH